MKYGSEIISFFNGSNIGIDGISSSSLGSSSNEFSSGGSLGLLAKTLSRIFLASSEEICKNDPPEATVRKPLDFGVRPMKKC